MSPRAGAATAEPWPEHWLPREVARTSRVVLVGHQRYQQFVVPMENARIRGRLVGLGYRLVNIHADPQDPRQNRSGVYQRQIPEGAEPEDTGRPPACCPQCGYAELHRGQLGDHRVCARCGVVLNDRTYGQYARGDVQ